MKARPILLACLALILLTACNLPAPPTPTALPRVLPTATPQPSIDPLSMAAEYLTDPRIVQYDPFNDMGGWNYRTDTGDLTNGMFVLAGTPGWQSSFWPQKQFTEGQGLAIRFKVDHANARSEFVFVTGDWLTDTFRQFGIYNSFIPKGDLFQGTLNLGGYDLQGTLDIQADTWYELLLAVGRDGHFLAVVWNPDDPSQRVVHDIAGGPNWAGRSWVFLPKANAGETVYVDDYFRLIFGDIK